MNHPDPDPDRHPLADLARHHEADPAEVDGPGPDWYAELAETNGTPWPVGAHITRLTSGTLAARQCVPARWPCPVCGGPEFCTDLAATLPYRQCGYAPVADPDGLWIHQ